MSALKRSAHETIKGLGIQINELTRSDSPMAWELAAEKMLELKHVIQRVLLEQEGEQECPAVKIVTRHEIDEAKAS